jgi:hypothetical protein
LADDIRHEQMQKNNKERNVRNYKCMGASFTVLSQ